MLIAAKYNLVIQQGATFRQRIIIRHTDGSPRDLSQYIARGMIRRRFDDPLPLAIFDCEDPTADGELVFGLTAFDTEQLDFETALYDIEIEQIGSSPIVVERVLQGSVVLSREVTK